MTRLCLLTRNFQSIRVATLVEEEDIKLLKSNDDLEIKVRHSRATGDEDEEAKETKHRKHSKKKPKGSTTTAKPGSTTGGPSKSTTSSKPSSQTTPSKGITTAKPGISTTGKPDGTTKKPEDGDQQELEELQREQDAERKLLIKIEEAIKEWAGWLHAHDKKTLNKIRATRLLKIMQNTYTANNIVSKPKVVPKIRFY